MFIEFGVYKEVIYGKVLLIFDCGVGNYVLLVNYKYCISGIVIVIVLDWG